MITGLLTNKETEMSGDFEGVQMLLRPGCVHHLNGDLVWFDGLLTAVQIDVYSEW